MVTNLPGEAKAKWAEVVAARSTAEKIRLMREFVSLVPKHKGTNKLLANVKRRIAILEDELEKEKTHRKGSRIHCFSVPKDGAGQIIILGPTKVGRSSLLAAVTNAKPQITSVPYTTQKPIVGMLPYLDIQFQLVEAPALIQGAAHGKMYGPQILGLARNADALILMVDLSENPLDQLSMLRSELDEAGINIRRPEGEIEIIRRGINAGLQVIGGGFLADCTLEDVRKLLTSYRINSALVKIRGKVTLDEIEDSLFSSNIYKPTIVVANKIDRPGAEEKLLQLEEELKDSHIPILAVSCEDKRGLNELGKHIFQILRIIRVYAKEPHENEPSRKPIVTEEDTTVIEATKKLHKSLYENFRYARIWGPSAKYPGQKVGSNHVLKDGDIIEIH